MIDRGVLIHYIIIYEHTRGILGDVIEAYRVSFLSLQSSPLNASSPVGRAVLPHPLLPAFSKFSISGGR
uniref:Uncharacterized protein n=1 Tax=Picea glauca TaxID=3330 RepID=A0A101LTX8_PICGL|nr:hypothetical protein ABT39_MTgene3457 [Picea glauca]